MTHRLLLIDDEQNILRALKRCLRVDGHIISIAHGGQEAVEMMKQHEPAVIICDQRMPGMTGPEVLAHAAKICPDSQQIVLTGQTDLKSAQQSINDGKIFHFLMKPWDDGHLRAVVGNAIANYDMHKELLRLHEVTTEQRDQLEQWNTKLEDRVRQRSAALSEAYADTLDALTLALDSREQASAGHSRRVAMYFLYMALKLELHEDELLTLYRGALLHDIGKIGIPDAVLLKPGRLDTEERKIIQEHVTIGASFLERVRYLNPSMNIPRYHHEKYDGTGYAQGLKGEEIPFEARIFSIVDVYDALLSVRPYKESMTHERASQIIIKDAGSHFDPAVVDAFVSVPIGHWRLLAEASSQTRDFQQLLDACRSIGSQNAECASPEKESNASILVIDDDLLSQRAINRLLQNNGFAVQLAESGAEGLEILSSRKFDLVVCDLSMPKMNGIDTINRIREMSTTGDVPIILLTGHDQPVQIMQGFKAGMEKYVSKARMNEALIPSIQAVLQRDNPSSSQGAANEAA